MDFSGDFFPLGQSLRTVSIKQTFGGRLAVGDLVLDRFERRAVEMSYC